MEITTMSINPTEILMEITIIATIIVVVTDISMVMIIIAINETKILKEITVIDDPGDGVELLFVGARRLSGVGRGRQADDQRGGIINVDASGIEADIYQQTDGKSNLDFILNCGIIHGAFLCSAPPFCLLNGHWAAMKQSHRPMP